MGLYLTDIGGYPNHRFEAKMGKKDILLKHFISRETKEGSGVFIRIDNHGSYETALLVDKPLGEGVFISIKNPLPKESFTQMFTAEERAAIIDEMSKIEFNYKDLVISEIDCAVNKEISCLNETYGLHKSEVIPSKLKSSNGLKIQQFAFNKDFVIRVESKNKRTDYTDRFHNRIIKHEIYNAIYVRSSGSYKCIYDYSDSTNEGRRRSINYNICNGVGNIIKFINEYSEKFVENLFLDIESYHK